MDQAGNIETVEAADRTLLKLGGLAALVAALMTLGEVISQGISPLPESVVDWFDLFQQNRIFGLIQFWGLEVVMFLMFAIMFLALYAALQKVDRGRMLIAITFALLGVGIFLATNNPFTMLSLSDQYASATTEAQQSIFLAAGQAMLANTNQRVVGGFNMGLFLVSIAGLIASAVMLQSKSLSRRAAQIGIIANTLSLLEYLRQALTSSELIAVLVILPNAILLIIWYVLIYREFFRLGVDSP